MTENHPRPPDGYWNEVDPPGPEDLGTLLSQGAEQVLTVSFLLELPFSIRIDQASFLVSTADPPWARWSQEALGALAGMPPLPSGIRPTHSIEIEDETVWRGRPHQATEQAFPSWWEGQDPPQPILSPDSPEENAEREPRTAVRVSLFTSVEDAEAQFDPAEDQPLIEWIARRFDDALELMNQYVVTLAAFHDEWHISSVSRIDLPRVLPYTLRIDPGDDGGPVLQHGSLDLWTWFTEDQPESRPAEEIQAAATVVREYQSGRQPFFPWIELYQSAEHHLGSGRYAQSVIAATTGIEVLVNTLFRVIWPAKSWGGEELTKALNVTSLKKQLTEHLQKVLNAEIDLTDESSAPGIWHRDCYLLRNAVVHEGVKPKPADALNAKLATGAFVRWIGEAMAPDPATDGVKTMLSRK